MKVLLIQMARQLVKLESFCLSSCIRVACQAHTLAKGARPRIAPPSSPMRQTRCSKSLGVGGKRRAAFHWCDGAEKMDARSSSPTGKLDWNPKERK